MTPDTPPAPASAETLEQRLRDMADASESMMGNLFRDDPIGDRQALREAADALRRLHALHYWHLCELHQPEVWEAGHSCPICEAHEIHERLKAAEAENETLRAFKAKTLEEAAVRRLDGEERVQRSREAADRLRVFVQKSEET